MRRFLPFLLCLGGCGDGAPDTPKPETAPSRPSPTLARTWRGLGLAEWLTRAGSPAASERADAAWAIGEIGSTNSEALAHLARLAGDDDPSVRHAALVAVGRSGRAAGPGVGEAVVGGLAASEAGLRSAARTAAAALGEILLPAVDRALGDADRRTRWAGLTALTAMGEIGRPALPKVFALWRNDPEASVRRAALFALPRMDAEGASAVAADLRVDDFVRRQEAAAALAEAGAPAVRSVVAVLADPDEVTAAVAAGVLADLGPVAAEAVEPLIEALRRPGPVRVNAHAALVAIGAPALPALRALAEGPDAEVTAIARDAAAAIEEGRTLPR
jgi:HEAT repeat protein